MQTNLVKVFNHFLFQDDTKNGWDDHSRRVIDTFNPGQLAIIVPVFPMTLKKGIFG